MMPMALGRSASPNAAGTTARDSGNTIPAPRPITARAAISSPAETDSAHHTDAARNTPSPASSSRLRPKRSPITPAGSMIPASVSRYASTIHCRSRVLACSAAEMAGSAIFKMVRSRATMTTDKHVTPSIHHRPARASARISASVMLVANMLITNILVGAAGAQVAGRLRGAALRAWLRASLRASLRCLAARPGCAAWRSCSAWHGSDAGAGSSGGACTGPGAPQVPDGGLPIGMRVAPDPSIGPCVPQGPNVGAHRMGCVSPRARLPAMAGTQGARYTRFAS